MVPVFIVGLFNSAGTGFFSYAAFSWAGGIGAGGFLLYFSSLVTFDDFMSKWTNDEHEYFWLSATYSVSCYGNARNWNRLLNCLQHEGTHVLLVLKKDFCRVLWFTANVARNVITIITSYKTTWQTKTIDCHTWFADATNTHRKLNDHPHERNKR